MLTVCATSSCAGCMACEAVCPTSAIKVHPGIDCYKPEIDEAACVNCDKCRRVCQQFHPAEFVEPIRWWQGWSADESDRLSSSSGGLASAIARGFVLAGGSVVACRYEAGSFGFEAADTVSSVDGFKGSKYVKSNPLEAYGLVRARLARGQKVLFIGLPCQVSSMRNFVGQAQSQNLYTVDLICHGTPSPLVFENYLSERGLTLEAVGSVAFRRKTKYAVCCDGHAIDGPGVMDRYSIAFLKGLSYTKNCYSCVYAMRKRVSDLTLGDSWGTELADEAAKGVSLVLVMTAKGDELLEWANLVLREVDIERAVNNNEQLVKPFSEPKTRNKFMNGIEGKKPFGRLTMCLLPKECIRQNIKHILIKLRLISPNFHQE